MSPHYITREHMLALHEALLKWLLTGVPPSLWENECLRDNISAPTITESRLH